MSAKHGGSTVAPRRRAPSTQAVRRPGTTRAAGRRAARRGSRWPGLRSPAVRTSIALAAVAVVAAVGFVIQSSRSNAGGVVAPRHALGTGGGEMLGSADAPVLLEEYGDFQCPACRRFQADVSPTIANLVRRGTVRFAFHQFAFLGPESIAASNASECAGDRGKFWPFHDALYAMTFAENSGYLSTDRLLSAGRQLGLTDRAFQACVRDGTYAGWVRQVTDQGSATGISQTPTIFVNGTPLTDLSPAGLEAAVRAAAP
jgi:protein-disulfide isomerase